MNLRERTCLRYLSILCIYVAYYFLWQGFRKSQRSFPKGNWIGRQIGDIATLDLNPWLVLAIFILSNPGRTLGLDGLFFSGGKGKG
jgi:hypothetical protein